MSALGTISAIPHVTPGPLASRKELSIAEMRAYLGRSRPQSAAEALRLLRAAYPEAPLSLRVSACGLAEG